MEKILLKPMAVAEILSIGRTRVYEMIASGEIESIRIGRSIRIPVAELHRWIRQQQGLIDSNQQYRKEAD